MEYETETPEWMNQEWFTTIVKQHSSDKTAKVNKVKVKPSLCPGEQFASIIYRAQIDYSTSSSVENSLSVVIKTTPTGGLRGEFAESSPLFRIELDMYNGPLKEIKDLLESVKDFENIFPRLIYHEYRPRQVIVLEDLGVVGGYEKITQQLENFEHSKMVFKRLAKYHAASFFLINEKKADYSRFNFSIFHMDNTVIRDKFLLESYDSFTKVLSSWEGYEDYVEKLKNFRGKLIEMGKELYEPNPSGYNVLNHADFHIKNLLFKRNGNNIEDFYMMDFQVSVLASPCVDLYYALYNSISDENRMARRDEIIHVYHTEFTATLKNLGFIGRIPSLLELQMDLLKYGRMEVVKSIVFKMFFYVDAAETKNEEIMTKTDSGDLKSTIYNDARYKKFIKAELPRLVQMGFL
jgi:thiamine kinase-like enzyme